MKCKVSSGLLQMPLDGGLDVPNNDIRALWREIKTIFNFEITICIVFKRYDET